MLGELSRHGTEYRLRTLAAKQVVYKSLWVRRLFFLQHLLLLLTDKFRTERTERQIRSVRVQALVTAKLIIRISSLSLWDFQVASILRSSLEPQTHNKIFPNPIGLHLKYNHGIL